jgi:ABC-type transporter Mla subunit MlaD
MKTLIALFCALSMSALAQINYNAAIGQAHKAVNETEAASQGSTRPMQPTQPQPQKPVATDPALAATLQNIASLRGDFDAMNANFAPQFFTNDLASAAAGTKASTSSVAKLAGDLQAAVGGNEKLFPQHEKLAQDIHAIFNSSHLDPTQQQAVGEWHPIKFLP